MSSDECGARAFWRRTSLSTTLGAAGRRGKGTTAPHPKVVRHCLGRAQPDVIETSSERAVAAIDSTRTGREQVTDMVSKSRSGGPAAPRLSRSSNATGKRTPRFSSVARSQLRWLVAGLAMGFLVPFVFADVLNVPRDLYYGIYATSVLVFFVLWARSSEQPLGEMLHRRWRLAVVLGVVCAVVLAFVVFRTEGTTPRPGGLALMGALVWRGVIYGAADGLMLSAFPILAVFAAAAGTRLRSRRTGKVALVALALMASLTMTSVYHLGYSDFRSEKLAKPITGDVIWSVPTLVTLNPLGATISHVGLHITAVLHSYDTETFLPPHQ